MKGFIKNFFYLEEENAEEQVDNGSQQKTQSVSQQPQARPESSNAVQSRYKKDRKVTKQEVVQTNNVVSLHTATSSNGAKVVLAEPRVYAEAQDIAENLKNKRATIVNLQRIDRESGIRIIDFLSGTVYALGGDIQRIGTDIFLCTPENVEVSGEISDYLIDES
jgi:cell division inhibitor SepF